jgi:hypothetical protein
MEESLLLQEETREMRRCDDGEVGMSRDLMKAKSLNRDNGRGQMRNRAPQRVQPITGMSHGSCMTAFL